MFNLGWGLAFGGIAQFFLSSETTLWDLLGIAVFMFGIMISTPVVKKALDWPIKHSNNIMELCSIYAILTFPLRCLR